MTTTKDNGMTPEQEKETRKQVESLPLEALKKDYPIPFEMLTDWWLDRMDEYADAKLESVLKRVNALEFKSDFEVKETTDVLNKIVMPYVVEKVSDIIRNAKSKKV